MKKRICIGLLLIGTFFMSACSGVVFNGNRIGNESHLIMDYSVLNRSDSIVFLGPAALLLLGVPSLEKVSVANLIAFMEILLRTNRYGGLVVGIVFFLLIGIISSILSGYYWCEGKTFIKKGYHKSKKLS